MTKSDRRAVTDRNRIPPMAAIKNWVRVAWFTLLALACLSSASSTASAETLRPFTSDGCSEFPDGTSAQRTLWRACCVEHDRAYWRGGTYEERIAADRALQECVARVGEPAIALVMLAGVRVGGSPFWPTSFRWGYGWPWPHGYRALTPEEQRQVAEAEQLSMIEVPPSSDTAIVVYPGYGDARRFVVEGRVIEARTAPQAGAWWNTLWRNTRQLMNDERKGVPVEVQIAAQRWSVVTDNEGYFRVEQELHRLPPGWHEATASSASEGAHGAGRVLITSPNNTLGIISDIDDTILISGVTTPVTLLANTFLKSPQERLAVPGMATLYRQLLQRNPQPEWTPVIYLSASPRQLHTNIETFLREQQFPDGVLITKKVTDDASSEPWLDQFAYKTAKIEDIFARLPHVKFILVGDDGERDPEIYDAIRRRHPQRVADVFIRRVSSNPQRARFADQGEPPVAQP